MTLPYALPPGVVAADTYTPDRLIAQDHPPLVTQNGTIAAGQTLVRGSLLGQVLDGAATAALNGGGSAHANTGTGTLTMDATTPVLGTAKPGIYTVMCVAAATDKGTFEVKDPNGRVLGEVVSAVSPGVVFADDIKFTLVTVNAGDFAVGDGFKVTVAAGSGQWKLAVSTALDGSQNPAAVLAADTDASGGAVIGPLYMSGNFNTRAMTFGTGVTAANAAAALRLLNIYLSTSQSATLV